MQHLRVYRSIFKSENEHRQKSFIKNFHTQKISQPQHQNLFPQNSPRTPSKRQSPHIHTSPCKVPARPSRSVPTFRLRLAPEDAPVGPGQTTNSRMEIVGCCRSRVVSEHRVLRCVLRFGVPGWCCSRNKLADCYCARVVFARGGVRAFDKCGWVRCYWFRQTVFSVICKSFVHSQWVFSLKYFSI